MSEDHQHTKAWDSFIYTLKTNPLRIHFTGGVLAKKISMFGSGFSLKPFSEKDKTQYTILKLEETDFDVPNSFMCRVSNHEWPGKFMSRDNRSKPSSTFGYNSTGGELIKVNLETLFEQLVEENSLRFSARMFVEGKDQHFGTYFGVFGSKDKLFWGPESKAEKVDIEILN